MWTIYEKQKRIQNFKETADLRYNFFDKKTSGSGIKNENTAKNKLAEELHKPIIRKFKKNKVHSTFIDNIWGADLADAELISKFNQKKNFYYVLLIFSVNMHGLFIPLKDKKGITITNAFQKILKNPIENQIKYGLIKAVNLTIDL